MTTDDPRPVPLTAEEALRRLHDIAKVEGWSEPRGTMFQYVHHPDCDERCWVVRALDAAIADAIEYLVSLSPGEDRLREAAQAILDLIDSDEGDVEMPTSLSRALRAALVSGEGERP